MTAPARALDVAFLDRDGVINRKAPGGDYVKRWDEFAFLPGAAAGIRRLNEAGLRVVVATNQRGIALGRMSEADLDDIHRRMRAALADEDARIDDVRHCPHDEDECDCRKPRTGMFRDAARDLGGLDPARSVVIGDSGSDMEAAAAIGARAVLVAGIGAPPVTAGVPVDHVAASLEEAARWVVEVGSAEGARAR